jgi:amidase
MHMRNECRFMVAVLVAVLARAETFHFAPTVYYRTFNATNPIALRVKPGDTVVTKTLDAAGGDEKGIKRHSVMGNPLTGPFYI